VKNENVYNELTPLEESYDSPIVSQNLYVEVRYRWRLEKRRRPRLSKDLTKAMGELIIDRLICNIQQYTVL
jgi:hypothetical protein